MIQNYEQDDIEINVQELYYTLRKKVLAIILVTAIFAAIAAGYTKYFITPVYLSSAQIYVLPMDGDSEEQMYNLSMGDQLAQDYIRIATTKTVLKQVIKNLNVDLDYYELQNNVVVENPEGTRFMVISVYDSNAKRAQKLAQEIAVVTSKVVSKKMGVPAPTIVDNAEVPVQPISQSMKTNVLIGAIIGFVLSILSVFIKFMLNDMINSEEDIERYLGINMLAKLPLNNNDKHHKKKKDKDFLDKLSVEKSRNTRKKRRRR